MKLRNRLFERRAPSRDAKSYFNFCEGNNREPQYFLYFKEINSKINVHVIRAVDGEDNSPTGLYEKAAACIIKSRQNPNPEFQLLDIDEVWFAIDTDKWGPKIKELRLQCKKHPNWYIAQSNPCFEVWLLSHFRRSSRSFASAKKACEELNTVWRQAFQNNYDKTDTAHYQRLGPMTRAAISNARLVRETDHRGAGEVEECNSSTEVYLLVERLLGPEPGKT